MTRLSYQERGHRYALDGHSVPSVTAITGVLDKPGLSWAAAEETALWATIHARELVEEQVPQAEWMEAAKGAHRKVWNARRDAGVILHTVAMDMVRGDPMPLEVDLDGRVVVVPNDVRDMATQAARFMDAWDVTPLVVEGLVYSDRFGYAGRFDLAGELGRDDARHWLLDYKTGKGVYPESCLQLNGYAGASHWVRPEDSVDVPMEELKLEAAGVVWIRPDGWELIPVDLDPRQFGIFLHLQEVHRWSKAPRGRHVFDPMPKPEGAAQKGTRP